MHTLKGWEVVQHILTNGTDYFTAHKGIGIENALQDDTGNEYQAKTLNEIDAKIENLSDLKLCKTCGKEIVADPEFAILFKEDAFDTCKDCENKESEIKRQLAEKEEKEHPEWFGPVNQEEPY